MLAFHNDPKVKRKYLDRVRRHARADQIIKGRYWEEGRGCAVGCTIHSYDHSAYERELGIPQSIARLEDTIFENLPLEDAKLWPEKFLKVIHPGADLKLVTARFMLWLFADEKHGVIRFVPAKTFPKQRAALEIVVHLYRRKLAGDDPSEREWSDAARAAWAAEAAAAAAAAWAAAAAAWAAAEAAAKAAWAAAAEAAAKAAWAAAAAEAAARAAAEAAEAAARAAAEAAEAAAKAAWAAAARAVARAAFWRAAAEQLLVFLSEAAE
jgi:hypothetical protein